MKKPKTLYRFLLSALLALVVAVRGLPGRAASAEAPTPAAAPTQMSNSTLALSISQPALRAGEVFEIAVKITSDTQTRAAQAGLKFDPTLVEVLGVVEGSYYRNWALANGGSTVLFPSSAMPDNAKGLTAPVGVSLMGGRFGAGPAGSGTLIAYQLRAKDGVKGLASFDIWDGLLADTSGIPARLGGLKVQGAQVAIGPGATPVAEQPTAALVTPEPAGVATQPADGQPSGGGGPSSGTLWELILAASAIVVFVGAAAVIVSVRRTREP